MKPIKTTRLALTTLLATLLVTPLLCLAQPAIGHSLTPAQADIATTNTAYLAAYFDKTEGGDNQPPESLHYAVSRDGFHFSPVNGTKVVLNSTLGDKKMRDPMILRDQKGMFHLVVTNSWDKLQFTVWDSRDLINWKNERLVVPGDADLKPTWAPEFGYDAKSRNYFVFWTAGKTGWDSTHFYYMTTPDFQNWSAPQTFFQHLEDGKNVPIMDGSVFEANRKFHLLYRMNDVIRQVTSSGGAMGPFDTDDHVALNIGGEGPFAYQLNGKNEWNMVFDYFGNNVGKWGVANSKSARDWTLVTDPKWPHFYPNGQAAFPEGVRHGSVLPINEAEYQAIDKKYGIMLVAPLSSARAAPQPTLLPTPPTFWTGADLSALTFREGQNFRYSDAQGEADLLRIARRNGWNMIRVRLWVDPKSDPFDAASSLQSVTQLGKRIKAEKLGFMLDIHYSDTWADPSAQRKPRAWEKLEFPALVEQTRVYSRHVIAHLRENGALPDMVQIGNETRNGLLYGSELNGAGPQLGGGFWEKTPNGRDRAVQLLNAGLKGVKQGAAPGKTPRTIVHVPDGQDPQFIADYFRELYASARKQNIDLDFDIIGLSYYPAHPWDKKVGYSGWKLERLQQSMNQLARDYGKPVMIVETAWPRAGNPGNDMAGAPQFAFTPAGQVEFYRALIGAVRAVPKGLGIGVLPWDQDSRNWDSVFDDRGHALPAVATLGRK